MHVVVGGRASDSNSLSIGVYHDASLRSIGQVGMAMPHRDAAQLDSFLKKIRRPTSPFSDLAAGAPVMFVEPHVVLDVTYLEITDAGTLRQPIFGAVRPDVLAGSVVADDRAISALATRSAAVKMRANQASESSHEVAGWPAAVSRLLTDPEALASGGFLADYAGLIRDPYALFSSLSGAPQNSES